jgi:hypothetical protein
MTRSVAIACTQRRSDTRPGLCLRDKRHCGRCRTHVAEVRAVGLWYCGVGSDVRRPRKGATVDEEVFNMSVRKFLKTLGVTAQREIELAVRERLDSGDLQGDETLDANATITVAGLSRDVTVTGQISLG